MKTTTYTGKNNIFKVSLTVKGGNKSGTGKIKKLDKTKVESIFVLTGKNEKYLIPTAIIGCSAINLGIKYDEYKV